ncbi:MAG: NAD(P)-binding domain-containing protein [Opitutales bacterium]
MLNLISKYTHWLHTQWPAGVPEKGPEIQENGLTNLPGVRIVGDLTGVPLLKFSADTGAKAVLGFIEEKGFEKQSSKTDVDVAIIGAGVSGISAAIEAKKAGLSYCVLEAQQAFSTIRNFPRRKPIYTYPTDMEPAGSMRFKSEVKEDLIDELEAQRQEFEIETRQAQVEAIEDKGSHRVLKTKGGEDIKAQRVVIAIGRTGNFRKLGVEGEELEKVSNRLIDPREFVGKKVLVVGGGDSALEAAISMAEEGATVALSYRRAEFQRPKPENIEKIEALQKAGSLKLFMASNIKKITDDRVFIDQNRASISLENDYVFSLIGREPPLEFFRRSGIKISGERSPKFWFTLAISLLIFGFIYHWKGYVNILGIPNTNLWQIFDQKDIFPFNLSILGEPGGFLHTLSQTAQTRPDFWYTFVYSLVIVIFGIKRIKTRKTPYITRQTLSLMAIQVLPLFLLPYVILPYMGALGAFTNGGIGEWFGMTFLSNGPGTNPDQYWRAFGFILAWPLFAFNVFTEAPIWGWLIVSLIQTFVIIPFIVIKWGKGAYCGWICSCGAMAETLGDGHRHKMPHGPFWNKLNMLGQAILAVAMILLVWRILGWMGIEWFANSFKSMVSELPVANYKYIVDLWLAGILGYGLYFHFSGRAWCRFACPLAALMHIYARFSKFRIFADKKKCISCNACTTVCHQGIDIMNFANKGKGMEDPECVRCSACVHVCPTGTLNFGSYDKDGKPQLEKLWASPVQQSEAELEKTPIDEYMEKAAKRVS